MPSKQIISNLKRYPLYPFRFQPIYKNYPWGGDALRTLFNRSVESGANVAESWEIADHANGQSIITNGPFLGATLHDLVSSRPEGFFGSESRLFDRFNRFPLMLKYIDAQDFISLQVHPSEAKAKELGLPDTGKTEAWVVVDAKPGSVIYAGLKPHCDRTRLEQALQEGDVESLLNRFEPKIGDCFLLEAGMLHSAGNGVVLAEVQQTSDMSFRVFDWNRETDKKNSRPLQVEQALQSINYMSRPFGPQVGHTTAHRNCERLVICDGFTLNRWNCEETFVWNSDNRCHIWTVLQGSATAIFHLGRRTTPEDYSGRQSDPIAMECLKRGDSMLVPNSCRSIQWAADSDEPAILLDISGV